jgi:hypothetical protein
LPHLAAIPLNKKVTKKRHGISALGFTCLCTCGWQGEQQTPGRDVNNGFRDARAEGREHQIDASERGCER